MRKVSGGFGLIETIVAMAIFVIIAVSGVSTVIHGIATGRLSEEETKATFLATEALEAATSARNQSWTGLSAGTYHPEKVTGRWSLVAGSEAIGKFTRQINVVGVQRTDAGCGAIVETGGVTDPDTFKVESAVTWNFSPGRPERVSLTKFLTRYDKPVTAGGGGYATLYGTSTTTGANLNLSAAPIIWSSTDYDPSFFTFSSGTRLYLNMPGDYLVSLTLPLTRSDASTLRTRIESVVRVNGVAASESIARSSYIKNENAHTESSNNSAFLLRGLAAGDYLEIYVSGIAQTGASYPVNITNRAALFVEYQDACKEIFSGTSSRTLAGTNLNSGASPLVFSEQRENSGFSHSDTLAPERIVLRTPGNYLVLINVPLSGGVARANVLGKVLLDGVQIPGGQFKQGYIRNADSDTESSIHFSGVATTALPNQVLTVTLEREAAVGGVTVGGNLAAIFIEKIPSGGVFVSRGIELTNGTNWNPAAAGYVRFTNDVSVDANFFGHSVSSAPQTITLTSAGDYLLVYNDSLTAVSGRPNPKITVFVNSSAFIGAETKSHYIRGAGGHSESSGSLVIPLNNLAAGDTIRIGVSREADSDTVAQNADALLFIWYKGL